MKNIVGLAANVGSNVAAALVVIILVWFRNIIIRKVATFGHWLASFTRQRRYVLVWIDDHRSQSAKICRILTSNDAKGYVYKSLEQPGSIFLYSMSIRRLSVIILIDSDVTKLADKPKVQKRIEKRLESFVARGGTLVGTHDVIYRRVRCTELQEMFGCQTTTFFPRRDGKVRYQLMPEAETHPLRADLPDQFDLDDGEVVWGKWAPDADVIYATPEDEPKPLVVAREHGDGRLVWLNSGDKAEWLCASVAAPEKPFIKLLVNSIRWAG